MKYYSELLDKMFDSEKDLLREEKEQKETESMCLYSQIESVLEQMYALDDKSDEFDKKLRELDEKYYTLTGENWFENGVYNLKDIRERAKKNYAVEIMGVVHVDPDTSLKIDSGYICCPAGPKGKPDVPEEPKCECEYHDCDCDCDCDCEHDTPTKGYQEIVNDHFLALVEKEFPMLAKTLRDYVGNVEDK